MRRIGIQAVFLVLAVSLATAASPRAKNVILFIGDAGGIPTLNAASLYRYGQPQKLFLQSFSQIGLMDTSAADTWVTDSAAGMTAIVTGQKTNNGVLSQSASAVRGKKDGEILKTILEYAEEQGLATGVLSNMAITDATPAACSAHATTRDAAGQIFAQVLSPRYGDGVDLILGAGRSAIFKATEALGLQMEPALREKGYATYDSLASVSPRDRRVVALFNTNDFSLDEAVDKALQILGQNPKGYFLMVEWDAHTDMLKRGLEQVAALDDVMRKTSSRVKDDTLMIFAADHSFDLRLLSGRPGEPLLLEPANGAGSTPAPRQNIRVGTGHTGEEVVVAAKGPGAEQVKGFFPNTQLFHIMLNAYGWRSGSGPRP